MYVNTSFSAELRLCMFARARARAGPRGVSNLGISSSHPSVGAFGWVRPEFCFGTMESKLANHSFMY